MVWASVECGHTLHKQQKVSYLSHFLDSLSDAAHEGNQRQCEHLPFYTEKSHT